MFTLGARAFVPGYRHKMVLCSHLGLANSRRSDRRGSAKRCEQKKKTGMAPLFGIPLMMI